MLKELKFNHIGVATKCLKKSLKKYELIGYSAVTDEIEVPTQNVRVCFIEKNNYPTIELIEPLKGGSPINNILEKNGTSPYHFCYSTSDIYKTIKELRSNRFSLLGKVVESSAFNNRLICFAYHTDFGLIEIVEDEKTFMNGKV